MSRIYHNEPLSSLPVSTIEWKSLWSPSIFQQGQGVLLEGTIMNRTRHVMSNQKQAKSRYFVIYVCVRRAHRRVFNSAGVETEPNFSETEKIRTGYLHSSYKTVAKGKSDLLSFAELVDLVQPQNLTALVQKNCGAGCVALWFEESQLDKIELSNNDEIRVRTKGNGPFVDSFGKLNSESSTVCNYAGGETVGASWTDKVMAVKGSQSSGSNTGAQNKDNEGAADDEWGD